MQWLLDKVMCRFLRHEAPIILTPKYGKGRAGYLFQGILSNRRSQPVVVQWFTVNWQAGRPLSVNSLDKLLEETGFAPGIANTGKASSLTEKVKAKLGDAVEEARRWIKVHGESRTVRLYDRVEEDRKRFEVWYQRSLDQIGKLRTHYSVAYKGRIPRNLEESLQRRKKNVEDRKLKRDRWLTETFEVVGTPYLKLAAVFVGE
jgi:hypothetical protein